jgi:ribosome-binding protein aMBF1 (putative translation factor)
MAPASPTPALADTIRLAREAAGLSKEGLAAQAGVSYKTVERLEAGTAIPRRATLTVITAALGIDLEPTTGAAA